MTEVQGLIERLRSTADTYVLGAEWVPDLLRQAAEELERASITRHRCVGCGHTWDSILKGAELCGDCWHTARPTLHGPDTHDPLAEDYRRSKTEPEDYQRSKREVVKPRLIKPPKKE